jgi:hypothetical protein
MRPDVTAAEEGKELIGKIETFPFQFSRHINLGKPVKGYLEEKWKVAYYREIVNAVGEPLRSNPCR